MSLDRSATAEFGAWRDRQMLYDVDLADPFQVREAFQQPPQGQEKSYLDRILDWLRSQYTSYKDCPSSPAYKEIIDVTARNMYDPKALGDINALKNKYNCNIKNEQDAIKYADEALKVAKDPFTDVHPPNEVAQLKSLQEGNYAGIGVRLDPPVKGETRPPRIESTMPGSPAEKAGLRKGDIITHINNKDVTGMSNEEVSALIRGNAGTKVQLMVQRDGVSRGVEITRANIDLPAVNEKAIPEGLAYIQLNDFMQNDSETEMQNALLKHKDARGYIIDLRGNPGGRMDKALQIASLFVDDGRLMSLRQRVDSDPSDPKYVSANFELTRDRIQATEASTGRVVETIPRLPDLVNKPVVILVDEGSASASEILTAALKDNGEAVVVGTTTHGKGVAQNIFTNMPGGSWLKVTAARYFTPNGVWLGDGYSQRIGIKPDVEVQNPQGVQPGSADDAQLKRGIEVLNAEIAKRR